MYPFPSNFVGWYDRRQNSEGLRRNTSAISLSVLYPLILFGVPLVYFNSLRVIKERWQIDSQPIKLVQTAI